MEEVKGLYAVGRGTPAVLNVTWHPAVLQTVTRKDPFSGKIVSVPDWIAAEGVGGEQIAAVYCGLVMAEAPEWVEPARLLKARVAGFHVGIVVDLWSVLVGEEAAVSAWKPSWISSDGEALLIAFPDAVTRWLAEPNDPDVSGVVNTWAGLPYTEEATGSDALMICRTFLSLVQPVARVARDRNGYVLASASGYVLP